MKTPQPFSQKLVSELKSQNLKKAATQRSLVRAASLRPQRSLVRKGLRPVAVSQVNSAEVQETSTTNE